jgi:hypothetical protein
MFQDFKDGDHLECNLQRGNTLWNSGEREWKKIAPFRGLVTFFSTGWKVESASCEKIVPFLLSQDGLQNVNYR